MAFWIGNRVNSHYFQYLSLGGSHNIRYPLYYKTFQCASFLRNHDDRHQYCCHLVDENDAKASNPHPSILSGSLSFLQRSQVSFHYSVLPLNSDGRRPPSGGRAGGESPIFFLVNSPSEFGEEFCTSKTSENKSFHHETNGRRGGIIYRTKWNSKIQSVDVAQEIERNSAAARHSWARQHTWLLLSFYPFPLRHPPHSRVRSLPWTRKQVEGPSAAKKGLLIGERRRSFIPEKTAPFSPNRITPECHLIPT